MTTRYALALGLTGAALLAAAAQARIVQSPPPIQAPPIPVPPVPATDPPPPPGFAFVNLATKAQLGDLRSQFSLGRIYLTGQGIKLDGHRDIGVNYPAAAAWLNKVAAQGEPEAQYDLAVMLRAGYGQPRNDTLAASWLQKAADSGYGPAQRDLGDMYHHGLGVTRDEAEAWKWLDLSIKTLAGEQIAADAALFKERDDAAAALGADDLAQAKTLEAAWKPAAPAPGQQVISAEVDLDIGRFDEARNLLTPLAQGGNRDAQFLLGMVYLFAFGVPKDTATAIVWLRKAADQGHAGAQSILGILYHLGQDVPEDDAAAFDLMWKAANQGVITAQVGVAGMYYKGQGVAQDTSAAYEWLARAARQGSGEAQYSQANLYYAGHFAGAAPVKAYMWLMLAPQYTGGSLRDLEIADLAKLKARLTPDQVQDAEALAQVWQPTFEVP